MDEPYVVTEIEAFGPFDSEENCRKITPLIFKAFEEVIIKQLVNYVING